MKSLLLVGLGTYLIFFATVIDSRALLLKTTVTATISAIEGDSSLQLGDVVTFRWIYDVSSSKMNSYCDGGEGVCNTCDITEYAEFNFLSDAIVKFSPHFDQILNKSLSLDNHQYSHKTVAYGGIIGDVGVSRFLHTCGDCYLSIINYREKKIMYMAVFQEGKESVKGTGYKFRNVKFNTTTVKGTPDPELATKLLSNTGILMLAEHTLKK